MNSHNSIPEDFENLFDDAHHKPIVGMKRLNKRRRVKFTGATDSPCELFIMNCLWMLLKLAIVNPQVPFTGTDTTIQAGHAESLDTLYQGNDITKPNHCFIKTYVEVMSCNFVFNIFGKISNAGKKFKGIGSTSTKYMKFLRRNQDIIIHTLHRFDSRVASQVFPNKKNNCTQDVHKIYTKRLSLKNKLKFTPNLSLFETSRYKTKLHIYLHQRYLLQGLMLEAEWNVKVLPPKFRKYLKIDNTLKIGNVVWLGKYVSPPDPVESESVSSGSELLSSGESSESDTD